MIHMGDWQEHTSSVIRTCLKALRVEPYPEGFLFVQRFNKSQEFFLLRETGMSSRDGGMESLSGEDYHLSEAPCGRCGPLSPKGNAYHASA